MQKHVELKTASVHIQNRPVHLTRTQKHIKIRGGGGAIAYFKMNLTFQFDELRKPI